MTLPRISIITPCRNQAAYLEQTICSVLDQAYPNLEYIVADGQSEDGTDEIVRLYRRSLAHYLRRPFSGPADAINQALALATGDYVGIMYGDDLYLPGVLNKVAEELASGDWPWVVGQCLRIGARDQMLGSIQPQAAPTLNHFLMHNSEPLLPIASFWKRELFRKCGALDMSLQYAFDYEWSCRLLTQEYSPQLLPVTIAAQREHADSRAARHPVETGLEYVATARRYAEFLPMSSRYQLWRNCDDRQRILTLAQAEMRGTQGYRFLWQQILRRPWWLASGSMRHALFKGPRGLTHESDAPTDQRRAA